MTEPTNAQLADWIEAGLATAGTQESSDDYFYRSNNVCLVCVDSLAAIGKVGLNKVESALDADGPKMSIEILADILEINLKRAERLESHHCHGKTAREIAAMLRRGEIGE